MFILDIDRKRTYMARTAFRYLLFAIAVLLFSEIYEYFSFGVWSPAMVFAAGIPMILGTLPALYLAAAAGERRMPGRLPLLLYHAGVITLTAGSLAKGVLAIYGTTNSLILVYPAAGIALTAAGAVLFLTALRR